MTAAIVLPLLQVDLGELYPTKDREEYLSQVVDAAIAFITREGITLEDTVEDLQLVEMYAAYLVRKRNTTEAMPRMLRWALNNRLFSQKSGG
nr:MAG TPA: Head Tail Connector Protein [Caudoviricetes sp.]